MNSKNPFKINCTYKKRYILKMKEKSKLKYKMKKE